MWQLSDHFDITACDATVRIRLMRTELTIDTWLKRVSLARYRVGPDYAIWETVCSTKRRGGGRIQSED